VINVVDEKKSKNVKNSLNNTETNSNEANNLTNNKDELISEFDDKDKENLDFIFGREWLRVKK
jgi:hypothetical protein